MKRTMPADEQEAYLLPSHRIRDSIMWDDNMKSLQPLFLLLFAVSCSSQTPPSGTLTTETLESEAIRGNVTGESPVRRITVYLPPSYGASLDRRYPVLYLLHGIQDSDQTWTRTWPMMESRAPYTTIQSLMDLGVAEGRFGEFIIVMPDAGTRFGGSFYVDSEATGKWEQFIVREIVNWIDGKYRTLSSAESRGIAGHSMGGYGAITLGVRYPEIFGAVYAMNPAVLGWGGEISPENPAFEAVLQARSAQDLLRAGPAALAIVALAQAFSPNRDKPPFFVDFPFVKSGDALVPAAGVYERWQSRFPVSTASEDAPKIGKLAAFRFDTAWEDEFPHIPITARAYARELHKAGAVFRFEEYNGDHRNRLWGRDGRLFSDVLPFFWRSLKAQPAP